MTMLGILQFITQLTLIAAAVFITTASISQLRASRHSITTSEFHTAAAEQMKVAASGIIDASLRMINHTRRYMLVIPEDINDDMCKAFTTGYNMCDCPTEEREPGRHHYTETHCCDRAGIAALFNHINAITQKTPEHEDKK